MMKEEEAGRNHESTNQAPSMHGPSTAGGFVAPPSYDQAVYPQIPPEQSQPAPHKQPLMDPAPQHYHQQPPPIQHQPMPQTVIVQNVAMSLPSEPCRITCPSCHANITTSVQYSASTKTHLLALLLCVIGCFPCACVPYCVDCCMAASHTCPSCNAFIGTQN